MVVLDDSSDGMYLVYWRNPKGTIDKLIAAFRNKGELDQYMDHCSCPVTGWRIIVDDPKGKTIRQIKIKSVTKIERIAELVEETVKLFNERK